MLRTSALLALVFCVIATHAWGQAPRPGTSSQQTAEPEEEEVDRLTSPLLRIPALGSTFAQTYPGTTAYPLELLGLLMAPMERRELNLLPSLAIAEEWTDNIFMNNANKQSEWITSFTPAVILLANRPHFQLATGFSNASEIYAKGTSSNDAFARQNFVIGALYQPSPFVTLSLADTFMRDQSPDARAGGFSLNGQGSLTNSLAPAVGWQVAPQTRVDFSALYSLLRLDDPSTGVESDTYGFMTTLSHGFTRRFTGQVGYNFTYLDMRSGNGDNSTTHTPLIGFSFRLTSTTTVSAIGGPSFTDLGDESFITPNISAGIVQRLPFGTATVSYSRNVAVAGGFGGPTDSQTISGTLLMPTWRDLLIIFSPGWTQAESLSDRQVQRVDIDAFSLTLGAAYRLNRYVTVFGGYSFFRQRVGRFSTTLDFDADQNRVKVGIQFGYPMGFDLGGS